MTTSPSPRSWHVEVAGKAYGPYSSADMTRFIAEGRVNGASKVAQSAAGPFVAAREIESFAQLLYPASRHDGDAAADREPANILIYVELATPRRLHESMAALGQFTEVTPSLILLRTRAGISRVRTVLGMALGPHDRMLLVDATRNRSAWHNMGPEVEAAFRAIWNAPLPPEEAESAAAPAQRPADKSRA